MNFKKIISIALIVVGAFMIGSAFYIKDQVAQGKIELAGAEEKVSQGKALFSLTPVTKEVGSELTKAADRKIADGHDQIAYYTNLAENLQLGGIILIVLGAGLLIFYGRKSRK